MGTADERSTIRSVAVPAEHGGWGFTLEPVLLGLAVAPGWAGAGLGVAAVFGFLARTPLKLVAGDRRRGRRPARTRVAERVGAAYLVAAAAGLAWAALRAESQGFWWPLLGALPLAAVQFWFDARSRSRRLAPELAGAVAAGSVAAAIALAGGEPARVAAGLWVVLAARSAASIPYARAQIRRGKGRPAAVGVVDAVQAAALLGVALAAAAGLVPRLGVAGIGLLAAASTIGMRRPPVRVETIGWTQIVLGLVIVALTAAGVHAGI